jgi:hypothetical protein
MPAVNREPAHGTGPAPPGVPPAARLVRTASPRPSLAPRPRPVPHLGQRGHAAADPGGHGCPLLRALPDCLPDGRRPRRCRRARRAAALGRARLLPPRPRHAPHRTPACRRAQRPLPQRSRGPRRPARHGALHRWRRPVAGVRPAAADPGGQQPARAVPAVRRPGGSDAGADPTPSLGPGRGTARQTGSGCRTRFPSGPRGPRWYLSRRPPWSCAAG